MLRRTFLYQSVAVLATASGAPQSNGDRLADAARKQLGVTTGYDPSYTRIAYPGGDVSRATGVCADVIVRAARDGLMLDLQKLLHEDMAKNFSVYPRTWGVRKPDSNIDHRRVLNIETYWQRQGSMLWRASGETAGDAFPMPVKGAIS